MDALVLAVIAGVFGGGGLGTVVTYWVTMRRQKHTEEMDLLPHLVNRIAALEATNAKCAEEHSKTQNELGRLQAAVQYQANHHTVATDLAKLVNAVITKMEAVEVYLHARAHDLMNAITPIPVAIEALKLLTGKMVALEVSTNANQASIAELKGMLHPVQVAPAKTGGE